MSTENFGTSTEYTGPTTGGPLSNDERLWGMLCHLAGFGFYVIPVIGGIVGPLVVWAIKKEEYPFVNDQGKEAINFQITVLIAYMVAGASLLLLIGFLLLPLVSLFQIIMTIIAAVKANNGEHYRYPLTIRFLS
jgi:uncharacterized Tic20 family protein